MTIVQQIGVCILGWWVSGMMWAIPHLLIGTNPNNEAVMRMVAVNSFIWVTIFLIMPK